MGKTMDVKEKITKLREERGWTKRRLAKEAGLNESAVYNWYSERNYEPRQLKMYVQLSGLLYLNFLLILKWIN